MKAISERLSRPPSDDLGEDQQLKPVFPEGATPTIETWQPLRKALHERWLDVLGSPSFEGVDGDAEVIDSFEAPDFRGTVFRQPTGPETRQLVLLMEPARTPHSPRPGAVVPFYYVDDMSGYDLAAKKKLVKREFAAFGEDLVRQGYVVVCVEAFPYNTVPDPRSDAPYAWWRAAAAKVLQGNPQWTGMGKLVWDTRLATNLLLRQPDVDKNRIAIIGHSLGGKMGFYAGCLDERIKATVGSDFGIGYSFTNWDAPWYLGEKIHDPEFNLAHHHLLALHAPRSFLLIGGKFDKPESWQHINEAGKVYKLYGKENALGFFNHASGHAPTRDSLVAAYRWLAEQFDLPEQNSQALR